MSAQRPSLIEFLRSHNVDQSVIGLIQQYYASLPPREPKTYVFDGRTFPFGNKYKGQSIGYICAKDRSYIHWVLTKCEITDKYPGLKEAIRKEIKVNI